MENIDISQIHNFWQFLIAIILFMLGSGGTLIFNFIKKIKSLKKEIETIKDTEQDSHLKKIDDKLELFEKTIGNLNNMIADIIERLDKKDDRERLMIDIQTNTNKVIEVKKCYNDELKSLFFAGSYEFNSLVKIVYASNFQVETNNLQEICLNLLKNVKPKVNYQKIIPDEKKLALFYNEVKNNIVIPEIDKFLLSFQKIKELTNGVRRKAFAEISLNLINNIVENTIITFFKYSK